MPETIRRRQSGRGARRHVRPRARCCSALPISSGAFACWSIPEALSPARLQSRFPIAAALVLDGLAFLALWYRDRLGLSPQAVSRGLCGYIGRSGCAVDGCSAYARSHDARANTASSPCCSVPGSARRPSSRSPPRPWRSSMRWSPWPAPAVSRHPEVLAGIGFLSLINVAYSVASARTMMTNARAGSPRGRRLARRCSSSTSSRTAAAAGSGKPTPGHLVLRLAAARRRLQMRARRAARPPVHRPAVGRHQRRTSLREERTLGFHLSARFPFSDVIVRAASDEDIHWSLSGNPMFDERGRFLGFRGIGTDLTEQRRSEQEISRLARFDLLTGLPNRALMRQTLDEALRNATRRRKGCALFLIDLDRFKNVNDTLGHPIGDALLRQVAERLKSVMGDHGQVGRLGGDEFKAVLPGTVETGLLESLARTLIEQVSRPYMIEGHRVTIGASVGIAIGDPGRACADSLIRNADLALYAAKAAGAGKHCFYEASRCTARRPTGSCSRTTFARRSTAARCGSPTSRSSRRERGDFRLRGAGALEPSGPRPDRARQVHPARRGMRHDRQDRRMGAATALRRSRELAGHVRIAVNLSPIQFNDPSIVDTVARAARETKVRARAARAGDHRGRVPRRQRRDRRHLRALKSLGVRLALDDFGTGYSSLGYLKKAPFDKIKIDQSFVRGAASTTNRNGAIIRAIVTLAETLGMDTTAEGVETHDDLHLIRELGVSQVQGYIFGKPARPTRRASWPTVTVEAEGFQCIREPRHRLMRRAIAAIDGVRPKSGCATSSRNGLMVGQVRRPVQRAIRSGPARARSAESAQRRHDQPWYVEAARRAAAKKAQPHRHQRLRTGFHR